MQPTSNQQQIQVDLKTTTGVLCEQCDSQQFTQGFFLRKVSRFVTGQQQDSIIPIVVFSCAKCDHVNKDFIPPGIELNENNDYLQLD